MPAETVTHALYPVAKDQKFDLLIAMLERTQFDSALIFTSTKIMADKLAHNAARYPVDKSRGRAERPE